MNDDINEFLSMVLCGWRKRCGEEGVYGYRIRVEMNCMK